MQAADKHRKAIATKEKKGNVFEGVTNRCRRDHLVNGSCRHRVGEAPVHDRSCDVQDAPACKQTEMMTHRGYSTRMARGGVCRQPICLGRYNDFCICPAMRGMLCLSRVLSWSSLVKKTGTLEPTYWYIPSEDSIARPACKVYESWGRMYLEQAAASQLPSAAAAPPAASRAPPALSEAASPAALPMALVPHMRRSSAGWRLATASAHKTASLQPPAGKVCFF